MVIVAKQGDIPRLEMASPLAPHVANAGGWSADGDGLIPELLPGNVCVQDSHQTKYDRFKSVRVTNRKPELPGLGV